jgi:hypothetical protein
MFRFGWLLVSLSAAAYAQDPFEIQVFEYEPLPRGAFTYDAHVNYTLDGARSFGGPVAPLRHQLHLSSEWTGGIDDEVRAGLVLLTAAVPGRGLEYAGFRILPHFYAPSSWGLPVNLGFAAELSFERPLFEENTRHLELRGIVEKHIGRLQMDGNVVLERALHGPGIRNGWGLEPSGRLGWQVSRSLTPSIEYYSSLGPLGNFLPAHRQIHLLFPGADWKIRDRFTWSFGVGMSPTDGASRLVLKSRLEFEFGRRSGHSVPGQKSN